MKHIFKPGDKVYFHARNKWVTLKDASTTRIPHLLELEGEGFFIDPTFAISLINPFDPNDPNNPPEFRVSRWIPVEERLPEKDGIYIVSEPTIYGVNALWFALGVDGLPDSITRDYWKFVTHWQPLPKGPEE